MTSGEETSNVRENGNGTAEPDRDGWTEVFTALVRRNFVYLEWLEGDSFKKRLLSCDKGSLIDGSPRCSGLVYNDLGVLIRCDDTVHLPDGSWLDCKTAIIRIVEQGGDGTSDLVSRYRRRHALISLSCLLRDGETVTLHDCRVLDNRTCLVEALFDRRTISREVELNAFLKYRSLFHGDPPRDGEVFLRLGFLLRDRTETVTLPDGRRLNGVECLVESQGQHCTAAVALLMLGSRLQDDESVQLRNGTTRTNRSCFFDAAKLTHVEAGQAWSRHFWAAMPVRDQLSNNAVNISDRAAIDIHAKAYLYLGLLLMREGRSAEMPNPDGIGANVNAVSCFASSLVAVRSSAAFFYLGLALGDGAPERKSIHLWVFMKMKRRDCFARSIELEDEI